MDDLDKNRLEYNLDGEHQRLLTYVNPSFRNKGKYIANKIRRRSRRCMNKSRTQSIELGRLTER
jgi:hypothetical protein